jgi:hypothetical protein
MPRPRIEIPELLVLHLVHLGVEHRSGCRPDWCDSTRSCARWCGEPGPSRAGSRCGPTGRRSAPARGNPSPRRRDGRGAAHLPSFNETNFSKSFLHTQNVEDAI